MATKCKKKSTSKNLDLAMRRTYDNKVAKLERQVKKNPGDFVAVHNLAVYRAEGLKARGFGG